MRRASLPEVMTPDAQKACMRENVSRKDAKARKGAKRCRVFGGFLCAFAGLGAFAFERSVLAQALLNAASQGKSIGRRSNKLYFVSALCSFAALVETEFCAGR